MHQELPEGLAFSALYFPEILLPSKLWIWMMSFSYEVRAYTLLQERQTWYSICQPKWYSLWTCLENILQKLNYTLAIFFPVSREPCLAVFVCSFLVALLDDEMGSSWEAVFSQWEFIVYFVLFFADSIVVW